jgi:hypothetical protein
MHILRTATLAASIALTLTIPALAGVTVNSPVNDTDVSSPFTLSAIAATCASQNVVSMGYSFDSSADTMVYYQQSIDASISAASGTHTVHVKAWAKGVSCVTDVTIKVSSSTTADSVISIPSNAASVSDIQVLSGWSSAHDTGGSGASSGALSLVSSPSLYGNTLRTITNFTNSGDQRYSVVFSDNTDAENYFYDGWVYLTSSAAYLANLEFDINQVMPDGKTVLTGVQCDGWTSNWAYTANEGTASSPKPTWVHASGTSCNPRKWSQNAWHHVQFSISRDSSGNVRYQSVWLDGTETKLNATVYGAASLGWGPVVNTQFQVDGYGSSGHVTAYLDHLVISMW